MSRKTFSFRRSGALAALMLIGLNDPALAALTPASPGSGTQAGNPADLRAKRSGPVLVPDGHVDPGMTVRSPTMPPQSTPVVRPRTATPNGTPIVPK